MKNKKNLTFLKFGDQLRVLEELDLGISDKELALKFGVSERKIE